MNEEVKRQLKAYYLAYKWANGREAAKKLRLSYSKGWYCVGSEKVRLSELQLMGQTLWARPCHDPDPFGIMSK